jgi:hypothetical protein
MDRGDILAIRSLAQTLKRQLITQCFYRLVSWQDNLFTPGKVTRDDDSDKNDTNTKMTQWCGSGLPVNPSLPVQDNQIADQSKHSRKNKQDQQKFPQTRQPDRCCGNKSNQKRHHQAPGSSAQIFFRPIQEWCYTQQECHQDTYGQIHLVVEGSVDLGGLAQQTRDERRRSTDEGQQGSGREKP